MNLLEIRTEAARLISETSTTSAYVLPADHTKFINEGIKYSCLKGELYIKTQSLTVATTVTTYNLPQQFIRMKNLLDHNGQPLIEMPLGDIGFRYKKTGYPLNFYINQVAITIPAWITLTAYIVFPATGIVSLVYIHPVAANGYIYECIIAGTTAAAEPTWGTPAVGSRITDGTVTWATRELFSSLYQLNLYDTPTTAGAGTGTYTYNYAAMDEGLNVDTDSPNFPLDRHFALVLFDAFRSAIKMKNPQLAENFLRDYAYILNLNLNQTKRDLMPNEVTE